MLQGVHRHSMAWIIIWISNSSDDDPLSINIPRAEALKKVPREKNQNRPVFVVTFDPSMTQTVRRTMVQDPYLKEVFPEPPLIAFRRQKNIREFLIRAKVPPAPSRPKRALPGMKKCGRWDVWHAPMLRLAKTSSQPPLTSLQSWTLQ